MFLGVTIMKVPGQGQSVESQRKTKFNVDHVSTEKFGEESASYFVHKIWNSIPQEIKFITTLAACRTKFKRWKPICSCRVCRIYIQSVGLI